MSKRINSYEDYNRNPKMIIRISKTEFEMDDGTIHPIPFELDEIPSIEEFQKIYDEWFRLFQNKNLISNLKHEVDNKHE